MKKQVDSQRIERIVEIVNKINKENNQGDILEFGIFEGFSLCEITKEVRKNNMKNRIFGFDSFKGLPNSSSENDYSMWRYQDYCSFKENTEKEMIEYIGNIDDITLIEGYYSDTLTPELKNKYNFKEASMIHVDCDMYSSALCSLNK